MRLLGAGGSRLPWVPHSVPSTFDQICAM